MSMEEGELSEPPEPVLFVRKENESDMDEDNDWDDTQLIREYDRAIAKTKRQVLKKFQAEMGLTNAEIKEVFGDSFANSQKRKTKKSKKNNHPIWSVGSACRALYSEDGEEYEAEIVRLMENNKCIVKFIGYENIEEVCLKDLAPSIGKYAVELQILDANYDKAVSEPIWSVGSACRALYSEDGEEYEAEIVRLVENNKCIVKFIGYENEEEVCLNDLAPSLGKSAIQVQIMASKIDKAILKPIWSVGSACRALYSEDGEEYEAEIVGLVENNKCIVKFIGYENEEEVCLNDLAPSLGKSAIELQIIGAKFDKAILENCRQGEMGTGGDTSSSKHENRQCYEKVPQPNMANARFSVDPKLMSFIQRPSMMHHIPPPPPPPPPPSVGRSFHVDTNCGQGEMDTGDDTSSSKCHEKVPQHHMANAMHSIDPKLMSSIQRPSMMHDIPPPPLPPPPPNVGRLFHVDTTQTEDDALNSLLMSWYMCGYYAGYYQRSLKN